MSANGTVLATRRRGSTDAERYTLSADAIGRPGPSGTMISLSLFGHLRLCDVHASPRRSRRNRSTDRIAQPITLTDSLDDIPHWSGFERLRKDIFGATALQEAAEGGRLLRMSVGARTNSPAEFTLCG